MKTKKRFVSTSKKLTFLVTAVWLLSIIAAIAGQLILDKDISNILNFTNSAFVFVLGYYFTKSGFENVMGIKPTETEDTMLV